MYVVLKAILKNCSFGIAAFGFQTQEGGRGIFFFQIKRSQKAEKIFLFFDQMQFLGTCFDKQTHM